MADTVFQGTARSVQFVEDGNWKRAQVFHYAHEAAALKNWLHLASNKIALEIAFEDETGQGAFFGVRLAGITKRREMCLQVLEYFGEPGKRSIQDFLRDVHSPFVGFPFMRDQPELLELGVVHEWRAFNPVKFWKKDSKQEPETGLKTALGAYTHYRDQLFEQPLAIELAYQLPVPHWLSIIISKNYRGKYRIDLPAAVQLCHKVSQKDCFV